MPPLHPVLEAGVDGSAIFTSNVVYLSSQDATAGLILGPTPNLGGALRQTWTIWLNGDAIPAEVNATLWSSPDGHLWAPCAQFQKRLAGPGGDVFDLPIASYFRVALDATWTGSPNKPAINSAVQSAR